MADATLFCTGVFLEQILPNHFGWTYQQVFGAFHIPSISPACVNGGSLSVHVCTRASHTNNNPPFPLLRFVCRQHMWGVWSDSRCSVRSIPLLRFVCRQRSANT